jgi:hypothetical protein
MTRARGQASRSLINREFPHRVVVLADSVGGRVLDDVHAFHDNRGLPVTCHSLRQDDQWFSAYCFAERRAAEQFQVLFGGELAKTP